MFCRLRSALKSCICWWRVTRRLQPRISEVSINTVTKLLVDAGTTCLAFQDEAIRIIKSKRVQCGEIWSFCQSKTATTP